MLPINIGFKNFNLTIFYIFDICNDYNLLANGIPKLSIQIFTQKYAYLKILKRNYFKNFVIQWEYESHTACTLTLIQKTVLWKRCLLLIQTKYYR